MAEGRQRPRIRIFPSTSCRSAELNFNQHTRWILEKLFDPLQESDGFTPVDDTVIVGQRNVHHGSDDDVASTGDRSLLDRVKRLAVHRAFHVRGSETKKLGL